jgi:RND family efflux transporter MFP subunit
LNFYQDFTMQSKFHFSFKPLTLSLLAVSVVSLASLGLSPTTAHAQGPAKPGAATTAKPALTVNITQARTGTVPMMLAANGSVMAWQEALVGAELAGMRIEELHANVGDSVQRGQLLATFAADSVQADVSLARASLAEASAHAAEASANADRARAVQDTGALSAQQVSQYLTAELTAQARVGSAQAALDSQTLRLKHTQVLAPDGGIISARSATVGAVAGAGTELFRLIRQGRLEWRAEVTSAELGHIKAGASVLVTAPNGAQRKGRVRMVSPTVDPQTRNALVYVDLLAAQDGKAVERHSFKPGMYARGEFVLGSSSALTVMQSAVMVRDGFSYVMRVGADSKVTQVKVQTGRRVGEQIELLSGVKPEDRLVATGAGFLAEGDVVRVVEESKQKSAVAPVKPAQAATK